MDSNLNEIATCWSDVRLAYDAPPEISKAALESILTRYERAIRRYLLGALRDSDAADEVFQNFACRLYTGAFRNADPARGRFRDLLRTSLSRMVTDHHRDRQRANQADFPSHPVADPHQPELDDEKRFLEIWLWDLMQRAWDLLASAEAQSQQPLYSVLKLRVEHPELDSTGLAQALQIQSGREFAVPQVRKLLYSARQRFISDFVSEVELTLRDPSPEELEDELGSLGMLDRCREHLRSRRAKARPKQAGQSLADSPW